MKLRILLLTAFLVLAGVVPREAEAQTSKRTLMQLAVDDSVYFPSDMQSYKVRGVCVQFRHAGDSVAFVLVWVNGTDTVRSFIPLLDGLGNSTLWAHPDTVSMVKCYTLAFQFGVTVQAIRPDSLRNGGRDTGDVTIQEYRPPWIGAVQWPVELERYTPHNPVAVCTLPKRTVIPSPYLTA